MCLLNVFISTLFLSPGRVRRSDPGIDLCLPCLSHDRVRFGLCGWGGTGRTAPPDGSFLSQSGLDFVASS